MDRIQQEMAEYINVKKWPELVDNLWSEYLPNIREIIFHMNIEFIQRENVELYGFPVPEEDTPFEDGLRKDLEVVEPAKYELQDSSELCCD